MMAHEELRQFEKSDGVKLLAWSETDYTGFTDYIKRYHVTPKTDAQKPQKTELALVYPFPIKRGKN
jgi:hypothetical protein